MASLVLHDVDEDLVRRLEERAEAAGRSAEDEHRHVLVEALRPRSSGAELWDRLSRGEKTDIDLDTVADQSTGRVSFD